MPKNYNRNRNTVTISADGGFLQSVFSGFTGQSGFVAEQFSGSEKTFLNLKLLQKCEEKIFKIKQDQYRQFMKNQQETNKILALIKAETIKQTAIQPLKGSEKIMQLNKQSRGNKSDRLISSWTAFVNLDITYKTKEAELLKQNKALHIKISQMEERIKGLYPSKGILGNKKSEIKLENKENSQYLSVENVQKIENRIREHKLLNERLKQKISKIQSEKAQVKGLLQILIDKCHKKYGYEVVEKIERMFERD